MRVAAAYVSLLWPQLPVPAESLRRVESI